MHISKMSHQHSSGQTTVCQVSPAAARTLNIGTESLSFRKGLEGRGGRWGGSIGRAEPLGQISRARSSVSPYLKGTARWLFPLKVKFPFLQRTGRKFFFLSKANSPSVYIAKDHFLKPGKVKKMLAFVVTCSLEYKNYTVAS